MDFRSDRIVSIMDIPGFEIRSGHPPIALSMTPTSESLPIEPLFVDDTLLVVDKPSGLLAVPGRGADKQDCLSARVQARYPGALIVHRLDMATSGLMVMARSQVFWVKGLSTRWFWYSMMLEAFTSKTGSCRTTSGLPSSTGHSGADLSL